MAGSGRDLDALLRDIIAAIDNIRHLDLIFTMRQ